MFSFQARIVDQVIAELQQMVYDAAVSPGDKREQGQRYVQAAAEPELSVRRGDKRGGSNLFH